MLILAILNQRPLIRHLHRPLQSICFLHRLHIIYFNSPENMLQLNSLQTLIYHMNARIESGF